MCTRFYIKESEPALLPILEGAAKSPLMARFHRKLASPLVTYGEVRPTNLAAAIASNRSGEAAVFPMRWGFTIEGRSAPLVNARVETASEKVSFRDSWKEHRCVIPASWYYEWQQPPSEDGRSKGSVKFAIQPKDSAVTWLCGLYRIEDGLPAFVILTREPGESIAEIHDRMPLIIPKKAVRAWVNPEVNAEDILQYALTDLVADKAV